MGFLVFFLALVSGSGTSFWSFGFARGFLTGFGFSCLSDRIFWFFCTMAPYLSRRNLRRS